MSVISTLKKSGDGVAPWSGRESHVVMEGRFDFSATGNALAQNDTAPLFDVPANFLLMGMAVEVVTAEGAACVVDIGLTGGDVDSFIDGADLNAAVGVTVKTGDAGTAEAIVALGGKLFTAADTLDLLALSAGGIGTAVMDVKVWGIDLSRGLA